MNTLIAHKVFLYMIFTTHYRNLRMTINTFNLHLVSYNVWNPKYFSIAWIENVDGKTAGNDRWNGRRNNVKTFCHQASKSKTKEKLAKYFKMMSWDEMCAACDALECTNFVQSCMKFRDFCQIEILCCSVYKNKRL